MNEFLSKTKSVLAKTFTKFQYNAPVILTFSLISLLALILGLATGGASTRLLFSVYRSQPTDVLSYLRLFGHVLGHANFDHFLSNFLIILLIGPLLEEKYGGKNILFVIIITAAVTGILNLALFPTMLLGASGVAFALILLGSFVNLQKGRIPLTFILVVLVFLGREIYNGLFTSDNISQLTHIAGGICGAFCGYTLNKNREKPAIEEKSAL